MFVTKLKFALGFVLTAALAVGAGGVSCWTYAAEQDKALPVAEVRAINDENPKSELRVERSSVKGWGSTIDPDNDCKFTFEKGKLTITVPGKDHDLGIERKRMNAPRVLQEIEGDFIIQVKVSGTFKPVDADTDDRAAFQGAGLLILEDDNTYLRLERACYIRDGETHHYTIWELRKNSAIEEFGSPADYPLEDGKDYFLRIERHGDKLLGATSQDGERWNYVAPRNVGFGKKLKVGVAAVNTSKQEFAPQFAEFKLFREVGK